MGPKIRPIYGPVSLLIIYYKQNKTKQVDGKYSNTMNYTCREIVLMTHAATECKIYTTV